MQATYAHHPCPPSAQPRLPPRPPHSNKVAPFVQFLGKALHFFFKSAIIKEEKVSFAARGGARHSTKLCTGEPIMFENFLIWEEDMEAAGVEACGMFSTTHIIVTLFCLVAVGVGVYLSRGIEEKRLRRIVLYIAVLVTVLECCKIAFNWVHGGWTPNHWLPLTFCSFSTYAYWLIACDSGRLYEAGKGFICGGGIIAGLTFLVIPMTSVATYPMLHLLSCYSMLYHSLMMYVGLTFLLNGYFRLDLAGYRRYLSYTLPACSFALLVNLVYGLFDDITLCNMMFLSDPHLLDDMIPLIGVVYRAFPPLYTIGAMAVYLTLPYFIPYGIAKVWAALRKKKKKA